LTPAPTRAEVFKALGLSPRYGSELLAAALDPAGTDDDAISTKAIACFSLYKWLITRPEFTSRLTPMALAATVAKIRPELVAFAKEFDAAAKIAPDTNIRPVFHVTISDGDWLSTTPQAGVGRWFYNIEDGSRLPELRFHPVTLLSCDVSALTLQTLSAVKAQRAQHKLRNVVLSEVEHESDRENA
jgi:hypothetical protein